MLTIQQLQSLAEKLERIRPGLENSNSSAEDAMVELLPEVIDALKAEATAFRREVRAFAIGMEQALKAKDVILGGNTWQANVPPTELLPNVSEKLSELKQQLRMAENYSHASKDLEADLHLDRAYDEAVHLANYAMMIADICNPSKRTSA